MKTICIKKKVLEFPFPWQEFLETNILRKDLDDRTVDWIIDSIGNTGKSSFAHFYISKEVTDGIFMKIDHLNCMELSLIKKIKTYRSKQNNLKIQKYCYLIFHVHRIFQKY